MTEEPAWRRIIGHHGTFLASLDLWDTDRVAKPRSIQSDYRALWSLRTAIGELVILEGPVVLVDARSLKPGNSAHILIHPMQPEAWLNIDAGATLVAIVSLGWTIYTAVHLNAARILVVIAHENILGAGPRREVVSATVTNVGRAPTKVLSIWISLGPRPSRLRRLIPRRWRPSESIFVTGYLADLSVTLPVILQPGDDATVRLPIEHVRGGLREQGRERDAVYCRATTTTAGSRPSRTLHLTLESAAASRR